MKKFIICLVIFIVLGIVAVIFGNKWFEEESAVNESTIEIFEGASVRQVAELLELGGTINSSDIFYMYIVFKQNYYDLAPWIDSKFEVTFKSGKFKIEKGNYDSLIATLNEHSNYVETNTSKLITFPEGITLEEMAAILDERGIVSKNDFLRLANDKNFYELLKDEYMWLPDYNQDRRYQLEGFLHANTYDFGGESAAQDIIRTMLNETDNWYEKHKITINNSDLNFGELITLASIVERESKFEEDRAKVAQVFYNRLLNGMKLQSDITAAYANNEHKTFMTYSDIETASPYNTYHVDGLPIGAINSPSYNSFLSVLEPEGLEFNALYFYARPSGETFYSNTLDEHIEITNKYEHEWLELGDNE